MLALDRAEEARPFFACAHQVLSADAALRADETDRLSRLSRLAAG